ncbi:IS200/IS605 family element RNA-guided endonuclease TnpB [Hespellia stercorisuis]|uniref:Putative transposase n=1 Tax=Hespellia stercorisuis DSM 15480 TaxID=1121950 RepID=A0A1M6UEF1_9FIRM|nr:IS200/IS605 family element RNA-guided endonuclease TnpB [Hespellia stercorisuis]SHK67547.1 putative transposase [Hespellia stercorisuis DSM 15480]
MRKGIKFRIYPNREQQNIMNQTLGCCRLIYNKGLAMRNEAYQNGNKIGYSQTSAMLTALKKHDDFSFLKTVDSIALQQSLRDLDRGFVNFFQKRARHPQFKSKHNRHQSYRTINQGDNIRIASKYIKLPKLGYVKVRQSMEVGKINNVTIEHTPTGKYFAVLNVEFEPQPMIRQGGTIGIDVGIKEFYSDSNGNHVPNPKYLEKSMRKLIREQRKLSCKQKGSKNCNKQRIKVALVHEKITNQRKDFLQKQSTMLIRENQTICIEDLKVKNMMRNHKLAQHISSASWSKFFDMLSYKSVWYGNNIVKVPTMYPSSQTCSCCGFKNPLIKNLAIRNWECPECQTKHDRDTNASINILNKGLQMQSA